MVGPCGGGGDFNNCRRMPPPGQESQFVGVDGSAGINIITEAQGPVAAEGGAGAGPSTKSLWWSGSLGERQRRVLLMWRLRVAPKTVQIREPSGSVLGGEGRPIWAAMQIGDPVWQRRGRLMWSRREVLGRIKFVICVSDRW